MKSLKLFFLDDDSEDLELLTEVAESFGHSVTLFSTPTALFDHLELQNETPDIIFTDIFMPLINGYEIIKQLKSLEALKNIPIIIYSDKCDEKCVEKCFELGVSYHIKKARSFTWLSSAMENIFNHEWQGHVPARKAFLIQQ